LVLLLLFVASRTPAPRQVAIVDSRFASHCCR
jgi:hypothetical protein